MNNFLFLNKRGQKADFSWLKDLEKIIERRFGRLKNISLALLTDLEIKELNRVYRKKNKATDVLSFVINSEDTLGEVLISLEQARIAAKKENKSLKVQLQLLSIHGILHLLGYDHEKSQKEEQKQKELEEEILNSLGR